MAAAEDGAKSSRLKYAASYDESIPRLPPLIHPISATRTPGLAHLTPDVLCHVSALKMKLDELCVNA